MSASYTLPDVSDHQNDTPITVTLESPTPPFVALDTDKNIITFYPTWPVDVGDLHTIAVKLSDPTASKVYTFKISILNHPPRYKDSSFTGYPDISVSVNH
jgi:hypothetical protein